MNYQMFIDEIEKLLKKHHEYLKHIENFTDGWIEIDIFDEINKLRKKYPEYDKSLINHLLWLYEQQIVKNKI